MKIAGLDADSKKLALVMFDNDSLENWFFFKSKVEDPAGRLLDLSKAFEIFIKTQKPDIIFIEESFYSNNFKTSRMITEVIGNLLFAIKGISEFINPFLPETSRKILKQLESQKSEPLFPRLRGQARI